jgi:hypothetical protein
MCVLHMVTRLSRIMECCFLAIIIRAKIIHRQDGTIAIHGVCRVDENLMGFTKKGRAFVNLVIKL